MINTITKISITQLNHNHYLMSKILSISLEHGCPGYMDSKTVKPQLALITIPGRCSIITPDL